MTIDLDALEKLAVRCTHGDPWYADGDLRGRQTFGEFLPQDRAFIAAVSPQTVLELIRMAHSRSVLEGCMWAVSKGGRSICQPPKHGQSVPSAEQPGLCVSQIAESETQQSLSSTDETQPRPSTHDDPVIDGHPLNEGIPPAPDKGPWAADVEGENVFLQSEDFAHDARLYVNGDFFSPTEKLAYAHGIAAVLNRTVASTPSEEEK